MKQILDNKTIVVTGCGGLLGSNLCYVLREKNIIGLFHKTLPTVPIRNKQSIDIANDEQVRRFLSMMKPDVIIHCAGMTNVDECEKYYDRAKQVNALGTFNLIKYAKEGSTFVYISTDAIFDGIKGNYTEKDTPTPLNNYGKTKLEGERFVKKYALNHIIIRTNFYGLAPQGRIGFIQWILRELNSGRKISMAKDWYYSPILVNELIDGIITLINSNARGVYNISSSDGCSKYEFTMSVAEEMGLDSGLINPVLLSELNLFAQRPQNMTLNNKHICTTYPVKLSEYREGITKFHKLVENDYGNNHFYPFVPL